MGRSRDNGEYKTVSNVRPLDAIRRQEFGGRMNGVRYIISQGGGSKQ